MYSKATEIAIAATSRLAEVYDEDDVRLSAADIAKSRHLPRPFVGKVLSTLATAGIVQSVRGPGGGFVLARHPGKIRLFDVARLFDRQDDPAVCPIGGGVCGDGDPCPVHDRLFEVRRAMDALMHETTFDVFRVAANERRAGRETRRRGRRRAAGAG